MLRRQLSSCLNQRPRRMGPCFRRDDVRGFSFQTAAARSHRFAISPQVFSREVCQVRPSPKRGRGECRAPDAPDSRVCNVVEKRTRVSRSHRNHPAFPTQWFYGFLRALPGDRALLSPSSACLNADLTPASGSQDHTTSPSASGALVTSAIHGHRSLLHDS